MTSVDALLAEYDREMAVTRRLLQRIPPDRLEWKPHPKSMTLSGIARHLAHMITWGQLALTRAESDVADRSAMPATATLAEIVSVFDRNVAATRALLAGRSSAEMAETWTLTHQGRPILSATRAAVVQSMILNHLIHHRGQLSVYLRLNDVPVPAIYGPSADDAP